MTSYSIESHQHQRREDGDQQALAQMDEGISRLLQGAWLPAAMGPCISLLAALWSRHRLLAPDRPLLR